MATLQQRNGSHRLLFQYAGKQYSFTIGKISELEAGQWKAKAEHLLMRLDQRLIELPDGVAITEFVKHDGRPPLDPAHKKSKTTTLHELRTSYLRTVGNGSVEKNTLYTAGIHLDHIELTLGKGFVLSGLTLSRLQSHIDRRQPGVSAVTIKKEIDSFRAAWNWGLRMGMAAAPFPAKGLVYPKTDAKMPFMGWAEIERRVQAGGDGEDLWECLYLDPPQVTELLAHTKEKKGPVWVYPMIAAAAHTGARRSELIRARLEDVDLAVGVMTIREKKRAKGIRTTRRVPVSKTLAEALAAQMEQQKGKVYLFGGGDHPLTVQATHKAFWRAMKKSKWAVLKGWHVLRHSFISACASRGLDQRIIDDCVGHTTEEQRRRYRHLFPAVTKAAIASVFG